MALTKVSTPAIKDEAITLAKLLHGDSNNNGKFLRANNGADPTFETVTGTTINNNANNRLITGSGTANTLEGESTLTYDGDGLLSMTSSSGPAEITLVAPSSNDSGIYFNDGSNDGAVSYDHSTQNMNFRANAVTRVRFDGPNNRILLKRTPSSDVDIVLAKAQRWGYSASYQGVIIGNPGVGNMSSLFLNYDPSSNASGAFAGDGREIVVRKNAKIIVPNAANNAFYNGIEFNAGGSRDDGVSRFRQGIIVSNDSADANVLDDYEVGNWTPTQGNFDTFNLSSGQYSATYVKIGKIVHLSFRQTGGELAWSQAKYIQGLPFGIAKIGAGSWTNDYPNSGGEILIWDSSPDKLYFAQADGYNTSNYRLVFSCTYETS